MNKPELGIKRVCASCGSRFFDLKREAVICPKCQAVFAVPPPPPPRPGRFAKPFARLEPDPVSPVRAELPDDVPEVEEEETIPPAFLDEDEDDLTQDHLAGIK